MHRHRTSPLERRAVLTLAWSERIVFFVIGVLLFVVALVLVGRAAMQVGPMIVSADPLRAGAAFLDIILLVLMIVELAYTVLLSLRGEVLVAEPFLIVGLIAVIRRILVITVNDAQGTTSRGALIELGIQTGIVLVFVVSIVLLRSRPHSEITHIDVFNVDDEPAPQPEAR